MASFKLVLSKHVKKNRKQAVNLQITINRRPIPRATGYEVFAKDWDAGKERVKASNPNFTEINAALREKVRKAEMEFAVLDASGVMPEAKLIANKTFATHDFFAFADAYNDSLTGHTQYRTQKG